MAGLPYPGPRPTAVHSSQCEALILLGFLDSQAGALPHKSLRVHFPSAGKSCSQLFIKGPLFFHEYSEG